MDNKTLLDCFAPYIAPHKHFDVVLSKYGPLYVYPVDRRGEMHEAEMLTGPDKIIETVVFQMICDTMESAQNHRTRPTEEEFSSVRSRVQSLLSDLDCEAEAMHEVDRYIKQYKEYEW